MEVESMDKKLTQKPQENLVSVTAGEVKLESSLVIPDGATGIVLFAHGSVVVAGSALPHVKAPTLLIVGGYDTPVIAMNENALLRNSSDPSQDNAFIINCNATDAVFLKGFLNFCLSAVEIWPRFWPIFSKTFN
jgi:hypothetical protein